jgi:hypothetical protein
MPQPEFRAAMMLAGKEIRKLNLARADSPVLALLRRSARVPRGRTKRGNHDAGPAGPEKARSRPAG